MTTHSRTSQLCLEIRISAGSGDWLELENAHGKIWRREPTELPDKLSTASTHHSGTSCPN